MASLREIAGYDAGRTIGFAEAGKRQRTLSDLGQRAAAGDWQGAQNAAFAGGETELGIRMKQMNDDDKQRLVGQAASWAYGADTPDKWEAGRAQWEQMGYDIGPFASRDALLSQALSIQDRMTEAYRGRQLALDREKLEADKADGGDLTASMKEFALAKDNPDFAKFLLEGKKSPITATDRKAIMEADETALAGEEVIRALDRALDLNDKSYGGPMASQRGYVTSLFGSDAGENTQEIENIITAQALDQLRATFGAMPTEGERKILLQIQGSVNQTPEVRRAIWERAKEAALRRIEFNRARADEMRTGEFYKPEGAGTPAPVAPDPDGWEDLGGGVRIREKR